MATPINTVPLGQAGTGSAFVLGESQAANQLLNTIQNNRKVAQQQELLKQEQAKQTAANWQKNQLKVDGGLYWQPEFNKRYQGHLEKGIKLRQMGIDPYNFNPNDPNQAALAEDYLLERQGILADTANRKSTETYLKGLSDKIKANPTNFYSSDIDKFHGFTQTPYDQAKNLPLPTLEERFKPNAVIQKVTPAQVGSEIVVGNKRIKSVKAVVPETRAAIVSGYANDPAAQRWVDELTGIHGMTIPELERIPDSRETIEKDLKAQYDGNPDLRTQLAAQGIIGSDSKEFKNFVTSESERLSSAKNKWNNQIQSDLSQILPKVKQMSSTLPDYSAENQAIKRAHLQLSREAADRAKANGNPNADALDRQVWIDEMLDGVPNSGERLKAIVKGRGYDGDMNIQIQGNKITFDIPSKTTEKITTKEDGTTSTSLKTIPGKKVTIDKTEQGAKYKFNEVLNELTGENIKVSKFATGEPSGKIKGARVSSAPAASKPTANTTKKTTTFIGLPKGGKF